MINTQRAATVTETDKTLTVHMHTHAFYEIYYPIYGDIKYHIEGRVHILKPRDLILTKKGEAHSIHINTQVPYDTLYVHFSEDAIVGSREQKARILAFLDGKPLGEHNCFPPTSFKNNNWQHYLSRIRDTNSDAQREVYLTTLLIELMEAYPQVTGSTATSDPIISIIEYINEHLTEALDIPQICAIFYISKTQLYRKFKLATSSSVWEYIIAKRLIMAHELLRQGIPPNQVCYRCGFNDYSWFYRVYKNKFGVSPKENQSHKMAKRKP